VLSGAASGAGLEGGIGTRIPRGHGGAVRIHRAQTAEAELRAMNANLSRRDEFDGR
jgi:hypothetical protein